MSWLFHWPIYEASTNQDSLSAVTCRLAEIRRLFASATPQSPILSLLVLDLDWKPLSFLDTPDPLVRWFALRNSLLIRSCKQLETGEIALVKERCGVPLFRRDYQQPTRPFPIDNNNELSKEVAFLA